MEWLPAGALDCVLMAQLVRMFAGDNPSVEEHHVVIVVDINLFVASEELIRPILDHPDKLVWNPLYDVTRRLTGGFQDFDGLYGTFCIDLMAMRARTWAEVTGYQGSLEELVRHFREEVKLVGTDGSVRLGGDMSMTRAFRCAPRRDASSGKNSDRGSALNS